MSKTGCFHGDIGEILESLEVCHLFTIYDPLTLCKTFWWLDIFKPNFCYIKDEVCF